MAENMEDVTLSTLNRGQPTRKYLRAIGAPAFPARGESAILFNESSHSYDELPRQYEFIKS